MDRVIASRFVTTRPLRACAVRLARAFLLVIGPSRSSWCSCGELELERRIEDGLIREHEPSRQNDADAENGVICRGAFQEGSAEPADDVKAEVETSLSLARRSQFT